MKNLAVIIVVASVLTAACSAPPPPSPIPTGQIDRPTGTLPPIQDFDLPTSTVTPPGFAETVIAGTVSALTQAVNEPQPPTETPRPTITPSPVPPTEPGPTLTPTFTPTPLPPTIYNTMLENGDLSTMAGFIERANLKRALNDPGGFTVFAPTNDAWAALDEDGFVSGLLIDEQALTNLIRFHVAPRRITLDDLTTAQSSFPTLLGVDFVPADQQAAGVTIERTITTPTNGIIHIVDQVLLPPEQVEE